MNNMINNNSERRSYTNEFKQDTVNRVLRTGKSCMEVGRELGIAGDLVARWKREQLSQMDESSTEIRLIKPSETEEALRLARAEISDLREQRDILKKALSIFSHPSKRSSLS